MKPLYPTDSSVSKGRVRKLLLENMLRDIFWPHKIAGGGKKKILQFVVIAKQPETQPLHLFSKDRLINPSFLVLRGISGCQNFSEVFQEVHL